MPSPWQKAVYTPPILRERQSIAQKGVRAIDARNSQLEMAKMLQNTSVRAAGL